MKKSFLSILIVMGLVSINSMANDSITISGTVLPAAVVGFSDVSGQTLNANDRFMDATIDMGTTELNSQFTTITNHFYTKSNNPNGVQISITPHAGENANGWLTGANGETLSATYYLDGFNQYNVATSPTVTLTSGATDGTTQGKTFVISPSVPNTQTAGIYNTVLDVTITCP